MSTIQETIDGVVGNDPMVAGHPYIGEAVRALEEREFAITDQLTEAAHREGLMPHRTREVLESTGLQFRPPPAPEPVQAEADEEMPGWARRIMNRLDSLTGFARQNGYRGE